jgi:hypothetical protein
MEKMLNCMYEVPEDAYECIFRRRGREKSFQRRRKNCSEWMKKMKIEIEKIMLRRKNEENAGASICTQHMFTYV